MIFFLGFSVLVLSRAANASVEPSSVLATSNAMTWTGTNLYRLQTIFHNTEAVAALDKETALQGYDSTLDNVGNFQIVDLRNDGHLELICLVDVTGRNWYATLIMFSQQGSKIVRSEIFTGGANIGSLDDRLVDLHHDGQKQLLIPRWLGQYEDASQPIATFTDVYQFDGRALVRGNAQFPGYYSTVALPSVQTKLGELLKEATPDGTTAQAFWRKKIAVLQQEIDEIQRTIGK